MRVSSKAVVTAALSLVEAEKSCQDIILYTGPGAVEEYVSYTANILKRALPMYTLVHADKEYLRDNAWLHKTCLVVIPGGRDRPYIEDFKDRVNQNLVNYVHSGGKYLGMGAGAYYASDRLEFTALTPEDCEERPLKFFPGMSHSPTFPGYDFDNKKGAQPVSISFSFKNKNISSLVFFNGGGSFINATSYPNVQVIGSYDEINCNRTAAVFCQVEKGAAILAHAHPGHFPNDSSTLLYKKLIPFIPNANNVWNHWLQLLGFEEELKSSQAPLIEVNDVRPESA